MTQPPSVDAAALEKAVEADVPDRIQGFHYSPEFVIRDVWRKPEDQVLWRGPDTDRETFEKMYDVERMRLSVNAYLAALASPAQVGDRELAAQECEQVARDLRAGKTDCSSAAQAAYWDGKAKRFRAAQVGEAEPFGYVSRTNPPEWHHRRKHDDDVPVYKHAKPQATDDVVRALEDAISDLKTASSVYGFFVDTQRYQAALRAQKPITEEGVG